MLFRRETGATPTENSERGDITRGEGERAGGEAAAGSGEGDVPCEPNAEPPAETVAAEDDEGSSKRGKRSTSSAALNSSLRICFVC